MQEVVVFRPNGDARTNIVLAETPATVRSLDEVEMGVLAELSRMQGFQGFETVQKTRTTAAGQPAFLLHLRGSVDGQPVEILTLNWRHPSGHPIQATLTVPTAQASFPEAKRSFDALVSSLTFQ